MELISIEGQMYKVTDKVEKAISDANIEGNYELQNDLMIEVENKYPCKGFINNYFYK